MNTPSVEMSPESSGKKIPAASSSVQTPFCGDLRSKSFFMLDVIPTDASQYLDESKHCWCFHTQQVLGPDGEFVAPEHCTAGRSCYRSALAERKPLRVT
jgi:hypothetical protein